MLNLLKVVFSLKGAKGVARTLMVAGTGSAIASASVDQYIALLSGLTALVGALTEGIVRVIEALNAKKGVVS